MCYVSSKSSPYLSLHVHKYSSLQYLCPWGQSLYIWNMCDSTPRTMVTHVTLQSVFISRPAGWSTDLYIFVCKYCMSIWNWKDKQLLFTVKGVVSTYHKGNHCVGELSSTVIYFGNTHSFLCTWLFVTCGFINFIYTTKCIFFFMWWKVFYFFYFLIIWNSCKSHIKDWDDLFY